MPEYVTVDEAAKLMSRSRATMWNLIRDYKLETFKRPGDRKTYIKREDVDRLMGTFEPREASAAA